MTKVAETTGLPHRLMSSLTQALFKQTSLCTMMQLGDQIRQMAARPNYVPRGGRK